MVVQTDSGMGAGMVVGIVLALLAGVLVFVLVFGGFGDNDGGTTIAPDVAPGNTTDGGSAPTNPAPTNMRIYYVAPNAA